MRRAILIILLISSCSCAHIWHNFTGEGNPKCTPKCKEILEECRFTWVECDSVFGYSCINSGIAVCMDR